jgi:hypothetical protein
MMVSFSNLHLAQAQEGPAATRVADVEGSGTGELGPISLDSTWVTTRRSEHGIAVAVQDGTVVETNLNAFRSVVHASLPVWLAGERLARHTGRSKRDRLEFDPMVHSSQADVLSLASRIRARY